MRVVMYARVSTDEQEASGHSLAQQQTKLEGYAALYDLDVAAVIVETESAKTLRRPGLERALDMLSSGEADGLVICKLDRLTRSIADWQTLIDEYFGEKAGKALFSVSDQIDTRSAGGRLVLNVLLSVAQWEREAISERTIAALQHKISNNERCGRIRYGYDLHSDGIHLMENESEQKTIALMMELRADGMSFERIADELANRGITTKAGKAWQQTSVNHVLRRLEDEAISLAS